MAQLPLTKNPPPGASLSEYPLRFVAGVPFALLKGMLLDR